MGLKKLNSEYNSRYKTFAVHRPVTTKAKFLSHPSGSAPEAQESSRRAGLLSNQFSNVTEPALQRKRIVPYKNNHNILSTSTVKELNDKDWLDAVGNGESELQAAGTVKRKDEKKVEDTEYNSHFAKLTVAEDSPIIRASKAKRDHKTPDQKRPAKRPNPQSPDRLPPAGIPTYHADPQDKRLLRPCDDLLYPEPFQDEHRKSKTEYSETYKNSVPATQDKKPPPSSEIDMATYKKVLLQRDDAYCLAARPSSSPARQQTLPRNTIPKAKYTRSQRARRSSLDSKTLSSYVSESGNKPLAKTYKLSKSKQNESKSISKTREANRYTTKRSLDEDSMSSIRSAKHLEAKTRLKKEAEKKTDEHHDRNKHEDLYAKSVSSIVSSRNSKSWNNEMKYKEKILAVDSRQRSAKNEATQCDLEQQSVSSIHSARALQNTPRKQNEKRSRSVGKKKGKQTLDEQPVSKGKRESRKMSHDNERDIRERGRSPTPEMRTAGQSRRHHLDITTGSNNPLATGPDPRPDINRSLYERAPYDPSRYSDVGESLASSRSFASWSDRYS
ncbi:nucleolar protein dao-5-like [Dendronephthya gigantea]|uniref:nucleolar protein dao-5-like n=1 Tax=Dendronephthya gigantea TaxID=151771 RepID=UPI001069CE56|nr:nucleolar protein dao-5-like [Dendronephthya gigantea]